MLQRFPQVLSARLVASIADALRDAEWMAGTGSAHGAARAAKDNLQLPPGSELARRLSGLVVDALRGHTQFMAAARPRAFGPMRVARYDTGMRYGTHLDAPIMRTPAPVRVDLSFTVFINDDYEGGELVIEDGGDPQRVRGSSGDVVAYPSTFLHRVDPITAGSRLVVVGWLQSLVRDPAQRALLFDLGATIDRLTEVHGESEDVRDLRRAQFNLLRMWAD